jgi:hypothetical protein
MLIIIHIIFLQISLVCVWCKCVCIIWLLCVFLFKLTILIQNWHNDDLTTCLWHLNRWHFVKSSNVMQKMIHSSLQLPFFSFLFSYTPLSLGVFVISWIIHIIVCLLPYFFVVFFPPLYPIVLWVFCHLIHIMVHFIFCFVVFGCSFLYFPFFTMFFCHPMHFYVVLNQPTPSSHFHILGILVTKTWLSCEGSRVWLSSPHVARRWCHCNSPLI